MTKWRLLGAACQAIVLGTLLFIAVARLIMVSAGTAIFTYQGY
jgi:hypothetical protein